MVFSAFIAQGKGGGRTPRRSRGWIWFFVILGILTATAITIQLLNAPQQLTPELFAEARKKWNEKGPRDYELEYVLKKIDSADKYQVEVRDGIVVSALRNGEVEEERLFRYASMRSLLGFIEDYLEQDRQPGQPRTYVTASFDPDDGHLLHYTRSVMSRRERQEIIVTKFEPIKGAGTNPDKRAP